MVDVDLGALKSVSRLHAKIEYDQDEDRFVLVVIGRNGAWVDGVWCASGSRAPLGERSQIQIAARTFHFVLPPPPPPEDSPSPGSASSGQRARSPSVEVEVDVDVDVTSISPPSSQPSHSPILDYKPLAPSPDPPTPPPPPPPKIRREPQPELPNSNNIGKSNKSNPKKRKKGETDPAPPLVRPRPEDIPPKPPFTYAQLIYRSIKDIGGKATLQEICNWIMTTHEYYRWADGAWMSSVRHNLSSGRAFLKMERCGGDRGKGFFWSVDEKYAAQLEEQESKAQQAAQAAAAGIVKEPKSGRKKDRNSTLEPALKRSVKGDTKGPLPPPLTSTPLPFKANLPQPTPAQASVVMSPSNPATTSVSTATTGIFAYPTQVQTSIQSSANGVTVTSSSSNTQNPYASLTQWNPQQVSSSVTPTPASATSSTSTVTASITSPQAPVYSPPSQAPPQSFASTVQSPPPAIQSPPVPTIGAPAPGSMVPDVHIPIILGPIPATHPDYAPGHLNNSIKEGYMVLHDRKLILDPDVFSGLTKENLAELEKMGARGALVVLTGHMVKALKERRAKAKNKDKAKKVKGSKKEKRPTTAPFTNAPLERRMTSGPAPAPGAPAPIVGVTPTPSSATPVAPVPCHPVMSFLAPPATHATSSVLAPPSAVPSVDAGPVTQDPGSPIINIEDSDDEGPAAKRRKLDDGGVATLSSLVSAVS